MKTQIIQLFTIILIAVAIIFNMSCSEKEETEDKNPVLSVVPSVTNIVFSQDGTILFADGEEIKQPFRVISNLNTSWDVTSNRTWLKIYKSGSRFSLSVDPSGFTPPDPGELTVIAGNAPPIKIGVRQFELEPILDVTPDYRTIILSGDGKTAFSDENEISPIFAVISNEAEWDVISNQSWLSVIKQGDTFTLSATDNNGANLLHATVTVKGVMAEPVIIEVTQNVLEKLVVTPSVSAIVLSPDGTIATSDDQTIQQSFAIETNQVSWNVESNQSWLSVSRSETGFTLSASINRDAERTSTVTISAGTAPIITFNVTQLTAKLDKTKWSHVNLAGDNTSETVRLRHFLYDDVVNSDNLWATLNEEPWLSLNPQRFTLDLGVTAQLYDFRLWGNLQPTGIYNEWSFKVFTVWGTDELKNDLNNPYYASDEWKADWQLLAECEVIKPSGMPVGTNTTEDIAAWNAGIPFKFDMSVSKMRYIRFEIIENWLWPGRFYASELTVYGDNR